MDSFVVIRHTLEPDGLPPGEGAFLACSFWLVDALLLIGRDEDAQRLVGNFPQAFSHIALVNSAHNLARATKPAEQRAAG
jgi:GH15 family glucan-1,4-alpha-glucosidase